MSNIILGTKTINVGDQVSGSKMYYWADCGSSCQNVEIKVTMSSGDPDLFGKVNGKPVMSGEYSCSSCECSSAYEKISNLDSLLYYLMSLNLTSSIHIFMYLFSQSIHWTNRSMYC